VWFDHFLGKLVGGYAYHDMFADIKSFHQQGSVPFMKLVKRASNTDYPELFPHDFSRLTRTNFL
jgi:hypothetical protein